MLPAELIDHILSFLRRDRPALKAYSEAYPIYSRLADRHLYTDIVVETAREWASQGSTTGSELYEQLSKNSHILDYPRTLDIWIPDYPSSTLSVMSMIPRMTNLTSLTLWRRPIDDYEDFLSTFRKCLQESSIEELYIHFFSGFPLSVLDHNKSIKKLLLSYCTTVQEPASSSGLPPLALETLRICGGNNPDVLFWAVHRVIRLTSLGLHYGTEDPRWTAVPELLASCSNSLTSLHLTVGDDCRSTFFLSTDHRAEGYWIDDLEFPFTLSALVCLKKLSVSASMYRKRATVNEIQCALPAILRLIQTAPSIQTLHLDFFCRAPDVASLTRMDWSALHQLRTPYIYLHIDGGSLNCSFSPQSILDALAGNEVLMDFVKRKVVTLNVEC